MTPETPTPGRHIPPDRHAPGRGTPDQAVPARVFLAVGAFIAILAVVYWFGSYEEAGTAMLVLAAALTVWAGVYLRPRAPETEDLGEEGSLGEDEALYLPHASVWPFGIGVGAFLLANGLLVGGWFFLPGAVVTALAMVGFVRQTRARD